jgi:hypothetical protein
MVCRLGLKLVVYNMNGVQVGAEVGGVQYAHIVEAVVGRQDKCGVESGILQKCLSSPSYLSDPGTGVGSDVAGEEGNTSSLGSTRCQKFGIWRHIHDCRNTY